jgi:hypothetical protein
VFDWLYSKAMPTLLGRTYLQKTILSLTGGDNSEYGHLENWIKAGPFGMSEHGLCGFHLVDCSRVIDPYGKQWILRGYLVNDKGELDKL